jgi:hypothetical protein
MHLHAVEVLLWARIEIQRNSKRWTQFAKMASSSNEWRFRRLHFQTGRSSAPLALGCSTFSEWISTSTMDRSCQERRPGALVLAPEISWSHTLRLLFLWGFVKEAVYVPSLPTNLDDLKKTVLKLRWTQWRKTFSFGCGTNSATI